MIQPEQMFKANWQIVDNGPGEYFEPVYFICLGLLIGLVTGCVISLFRILKGSAYNFALNWTASHSHDLPVILAWLLIAILASLLVGYLIRNPAIRGGGAEWIGKTLEDGQAKPWLKILFPKFLGIFLVLGFGLSVGSEGPCVQMGAALAAGLKKFDLKQQAERTFFIIAGCASGLAAAFSAPFSGISYVYEIMNARMSKSLFIFLLASAMGVYFVCTRFFGLGVMLPLYDAQMPRIGYLWLLLPLGVFTGFIGAAYNYLLRWFIALYEHLTFLPDFLKPLSAFAGAAALMIFLPSLTGEGMDFFSRINTAQVFVGFLCFFVLAKLFFTAFCYGSGIPAGMMVPILCIGGVAGIIFAKATMLLGYSGEGWIAGCMAMGMAGSFAAAERAPLTGLVLVLEMTGAFSVIPGIFMVGAIASYCARLCKVTRL